MACAKHKQLIFLSRRCYVSDKRPVTQAVNNETRKIVGKLAVTGFTLFNTVVIELWPSIVCEYIKIIPPIFYLVGRRMGIFDYWYRDLKCLDQ